MARSRRGNKYSSNSTSDPLKLLIGPYPSITTPKGPRVTVSTNLWEIEDRRTYFPAGRAMRPALSLPGTRSPPLKAKSLSRVKFGDPGRVLICIRRKKRQEILHALKKTGKGKPRRSPKRNFHSYISCKG